MTNTPQSMSEEELEQEFVKMFRVGLEPLATVLGQNGELFDTLLVQLSKASTTVATQYSLTKQLEAKYKLASSITTDKGDAYYQGVPIEHYAEQLKHQLGKDK